MERGEKTSVSKCHYWQERPSSDPNHNPFSVRNCSIWDERSPLLQKFLPHLKFFTRYMYVGVNSFESDYRIPSRSKCTNVYSTSSFTTLKLRKHWFLLEWWTPLKSPKFDNSWRSFKKENILKKWKSHRRFWRGSSQCCQDELGQFWWSYLKSEFGPSHI